MSDLWKEVARVLEMDDPIREEPKDGPELDLTERYMELRGISYHTITDHAVLQLHARGQSMGYTPSRGYQVSKNVIIFTIEQAVSYNLWGRL